jgi:hypothetical protein
MANLFNNDIGLNYKGLINIGSTINQNISGSLQYLTDGDGNNLPIQVSTTGLVLGNANAAVYINLNDSGINFFDAIETRYRNVAGTTLAMNVWGDLGRVAIGGLATNYTPTASLHVRGDGTNLTGRFEASDGTAILTIPAVAANLGVLQFRGFYMGFANNPSQLIGIENGTFLFYNGLNRFTISPAGVVTLYNSLTTLNTLPTLTLGTGAALSTINVPRYAFTPTGSVITTSGTSQGLAYTDTFAAAAGSGSYRPLSIAYTINNTGAQTGNTTGIFLNATETALNSMTHNLMDLQVGGVSRLRIINSGNVVIGDASAPSASRLNVAGDIFLRTNDNIGGGQTYGTIWNKIMPYNSSNGEMAITMYNTSWFLRHNANMSVAGNTVIGTTTPTARLHVRGDGTNPVARFENSAGSTRTIINADGSFATIGYGAEVNRLQFNGGTLGVNRGFITAGANGIFSLLNASENDFGRLNFGGGTAFYPSLKRSTASLQSRLADDSDFTFIQGKLQTENDFVSESIIMASGYIVLYDRNGTAYKVLATAL